MKPTLTFLIVLLTLVAPLPAQEVFESTSAVGIPVE
jgi:hypothetical protein